MGIKNLKYLIGKYAAGAVNEIFLYSYENKVLAIDTSIYLYRFIYKNGEPLELLVKQIMRLLKNKIIPLYIFDGKPPKEKNEVLDERNEKKKELTTRQAQIKILIKKKSKEKKDKEDNVKESNIEEFLEEQPLTTESPHIETKGIEEIDSEEIITDEITIAEDLKDMSLEELREELEKVEKRIIVVNGKVISECKKLFDLMGIPYIIANGEAESLCAWLIKKELVCGCLSEDTDILANGGKLFIRNFNVNNNKVIVYDLDKILKSLGVNYQEFVDICILCGCDYTSTIKNIGVEKAYKFIKDYKNIEDVIEYVNEYNKKNIEKNKDARYIVPKNFDYKTARHLFYTCGQKEDYNRCKEIIKLSTPQVDNILKFLGDDIKITVKNDIKRNLKKFHETIERDRTKTIDSFFGKI